MTGWGPALRIARREMLRAKGRNLLVLLMVLLPVVAVSAFSTLARTADVDVRESLPRELGDATARLDAGTGRVQQDPELSTVVQYDPVPPADEQDLLAVLPEGSRLLTAVVPYDTVRLDVGDRVRRVSSVAVDLSDPSLASPFEVLQGRAPSGPDEIAVSPALGERVAVGSTVAVDDARRTVTGVLRAPRDLAYSDTVLGSAAAVGEPRGDALRRSWVTGPQVSWEDVLELNELGVTVLSRAVVLDPPADAAVPDDPYGGDAAEVTLAVVALITAMAVLQVVLLAGPALAVGARRQRRSLALLAAGGASPPQVRRVVLAQGVLVGLVSAGVGVPLGVAVAALARDPLTAVTGSEWGPFDVAPLDLLLVAVLGAGTALLAALWPAATVARQPLVAALQGRRLAAGGARRPAVAGLVLVAVGVAVIVTSLQGSSPYGYAELGVALGALPTVLGAVLLAPAALSLVGRLAGRLPLPLRFAARDADRQRGRTAPAVAAITAVVAGVVALATGAGSDAADQRDRYVPSGPSGVAVVTAYEPDVDLAELEGLARRALPDEPVRAVSGVRPPVGSPEGYTAVEVCQQGEVAPSGRCELLLASYSSSLGSDLLVGADGLAALGDLVPAAELRQAEQALARGEVLLAVTPRSADALGGQLPERVELRTTRFVPAPDGTERSEVLGTVEAPAQAVELTGDVAPFRAVLPEAVGRELGAVPVGLLVGDDLGRDDEQVLREALERADEAVGVRVERGYESTGDRTVLLALCIGVTVLVVGGTLAATSLALSESRPDLATLGQVGARPRTRRLVAGGYALVLGLVGAVLGTAAGLVPGVAVAVPLTRGYGDTGEAVDGFVVDVPWTVIGLVVVVLPLVSALVAALAARGRVDVPRRVAA